MLFILVKKAPSCSVMEVMQTHLWQRSEGGVTQLCQEELYK